MLTKMVLETSNESDGQLGRFFCEGCFFLKEVVCARLAGLITSPWGPLLSLFSLSIDKVLILSRFLSNESINVY